VEVEQRPLADLGHLPAGPSLVLHLAFLTQEKANTMSAAAYAAANWAISLSVLAAVERIDAQAVFLASSGAVYLADSAAAPASKRLYGALKLEDEARFSHWGEETGRPVAIARVFNLAGPYINKRASYALACFIADALADRPIAILAAHRVYRSYVAIEELMSVVLGVLTAPAAGVVTFDTAGEVAPELAGVAGAVGDCLRPNLPVRRPLLTGDAPDRYVGDGAYFRALRERFGVRPVGFAEQIRQTADYMAEWPDPFDTLSERV
jgi:nucleoside-diphosphate-sugar epimerase